jgi:dUTP pyrophosphatase
MVMKIYVKQLYDDKGNKIPITLPKKGSDVAAGYDIVATSDPKIVGVEGKFKNSWSRVDYIEYETNLYIAPETVTFHTLIHPRSSVSKYNLVLANSIGLVDNDYRGMVICRFKYIWQPIDLKTDPTDNRFSIVGEIDLEKIYKKGDTIAQLVFEPTVMANFELVDDLTQTKRGAGGFGSTDKPKVEPKPIIGKSLSDMYNEAGGVPVRERYSEEIRKREAGL